jgi:hypothetical protein
MDLEFDLNNDFVFTTDKNGCLKGGGFKIDSYLLNNTINNKDNSIHQSGGGGINIMNNFKDLVVPAGLFLSQKIIQKNNTIRYNYKDEHINDDIYDKLLNMVAPDKRKIHSRNTKSKKENKKRKSRRVK